MKVLTIAGYPSGKYREERDLARVWVDDKHRVYVEPVNLAKVEFAVELQRLIDRRIARNPEEPFFKLVPVYDDGNLGDKLQAIHPSDPDFLESFMGEFTLFGWGAPDNIAGYVASNGGSRVTEE